jgi:hypothetical protein
MTLAREQLLVERASLTARKSLLTESHALLTGGAWADDEVEDISALMSPKASLNEVEAPF